MNFKERRKKHIGFFFRKKNSEPKKPRAVAFVDYEHWYISLDKMYHIRPDIKGWTEDMSKTLDVKDIYFFGDFSKNLSLRDEITKIRGFSNKIIETGNANDRVSKDFTDFIMLDHIYQEAMANKDNIDVFIIFTGDGHFNSVASFLKNILKKEVGIYAVKGGFSNQLKSTASWWVEYPDEESKYAPIFQLVFTSLDHIEKAKGRKMKPTFIKTVDAVSKYNNLPKDEVRSAVQWLVDNGYLVRNNEYAFGKKIVTISANWYEVARAGLWVPEKEK